eukprot:1151233-Pelagomonas_calceolata.AAC.1
MQGMHSNDWVNFHMRGSSAGKKEKRLMQWEHSLYQQRTSRHIGCKSLESPSTEGEKEANMGLGACERGGNWTCGSEKWEKEGPGVQEHD